MNRLKGSALILVLWSLSLLTVLVVSLGYGVRQKLSLQQRLEALDGLYTIAFAGVEQAKSVVKSDADIEFDAFSENWASSKGLFKDIEVSGGRFSVSYSVASEETGAKQWFGLVDEERKINLNTADASTLTRLFEESADPGHDTAEELAYNVIDWRDNDSNFQHPSYGAEDKNYEDLSVPYQAKDAPLEAIDELLLIKGINRTVFDKIKPFVTIVGSGAININTASSEVLLALGLPDTLVEKVIRYRAGVDGEEGTVDDSYFKDKGGITGILEKLSPPIDLPEKSVLDKLITDGKIAVASTYFMAQCQGRFLKNSATLELEAVFDRSGNTVYSHVFEVQ